MIIIGALLALFLISFFLKKRVGVAILASFAGTIFYNTITKFFVALHNTTHISLDIIENAAFLILVVALPLLVYLFSKKNWSPAILRILSSAIFSIIVVTLCSGVISHLFKIDALGTNITNLMNQNRGFILTAGIIIAYLDILLPHRDYD